ncbi:MULTISPECIES: hypothetical protein [Sphingobacterium]|uniref:hypothetical protein n=1 Tax=Sphingobacterium TaxID=28453 RepID=UPI00257A795E|nr:MULTISPECIES: hypothetical protein [Sphingobacterium]
MISYACLKHLSIIGNEIHTNDGYIFEKKSYYPLQPIEFENATFYHPAVATDILDTMYCSKSHQSSKRGKTSKLDA